MRTVGAYEAKTHFSELLDAVEQGETVIVTRRGTEVARIVPARAHDRAAVEATIARIKRLREQTGRMTVDEILAAIRAGRRM